VLNQLNPGYVPLLTFLGTLLIVAVGILYNNSRITDFSSRITDVKDLIQAEARVSEANLRRLEEKTDRLEQKTDRLEQKIDRVENLLLTRLADHDTRLRRLESS
jgi:Tfp pilus assembly protein PilN